MIRVFLADDHAIVRDGLCRLIAAAGDMEVAGDTGRGRVVLERAGRESWDVLVLDLVLEDVGGFEVLRRLHENVPKLPVVVLSMFNEAQYGARVLRMGAAAYLSKRRSSETLLEAIRTAARGRRYVTPEVAEALVTSTAGQQNPHEGLSPREFQVFQLVAEGLAPGEITAQLDLSPSTVSSHLMHIRQKLGLRTNGEIVRYAYRSSLVGGGSLDPTRP